MTYRELQTTIAALRNQGVATPKLNSKYEVLQAWYAAYIADQEEVEVVDVTDFVFDVTCHEAELFTQWYEQQQLAEEIDRIFSLDPDAEWFENSCVDQVAALTIDEVLFEVFRFTEAELAELAEIFTLPLDAELFEPDEQEASDEAFAILAALAA